jgi:rubrerythrin
MSEQQGISVTNACYSCYILDDVCMDCEDSRLTKEAIAVHEIVDEGNDIYRYAPMYTSMTKIDKAESGHEWVGSTTRVEPYFVWATQSWEDTRDEFLEPISLLTDRLYELNTDMPPNSMVCQTCHYTCNKHAQCPNCN